MSEADQAIIDSVVECLRATGLFAAVSNGPDRMQSLVPRAAVLFKSHHVQPADDGDALWHRLRMEVSIHAAGADVGAAMARALELYQRSRRAILSEPFRGGLARHLPWGRATELGPGSIASGSKPPSCELRFELLCHYETTGEA